MADTPKHSRGSHFASGTPSTPSTPAASPKRSGARFKTNAASGAANSPSATGMVSTVQPRTRAQRAADARGGHGSAGAIVGLIVGVVVVAVLAVMVVPHLFAATTPSPTQAELENQGQQVEVVIADGSGAYDVAATLANAGLIASQDDFVQEMISQGADSSLKSGAYVFTIGQDYESIVQQLVQGPNSTSATFTVPEGSTLAQIASIVAEKINGVTAEDFTAQAKASNYASDYSFLAGVATDQYDTLEGFLYPETYNFSGQTDVTADTIIRAMLDQFQTELATLDMSYVESQGLTVAQMVNLASIVEKESTQSTGAMVAAVFWNRLENQGDPTYGYLQSDATTAYSVGREPTADEVHDANDPYSTYAYQGLPPTPICNPGMTSLQNVCSPDMDYVNGGYYYFYFWNDENGEIQFAFSKTLEEHNAAIYGSN